jgi:tRNA 2-thiouridine synthesizing protein A
LEFHKEVDAIGLKCPMPILRCKKALSELKEAEILKIVATDTGAIKDFQAFCKQTGHELLELNSENDTYTFYIKKRLL